MRVLKQEITKLKLPNINSLYSCNEYNETYNWNKRGGHSGDNTIDKIKSRLKDLDWIPISFQNSQIDNKIGGEVVYQNPERTVQIKLYRYLGSEVSSNRYRISVTLL